MQNNVTELTQKLLKSLDSNYNVRKLKTWKIFGFLRGHVQAMTTRWTVMCSYPFQCVNKVVYLSSDGTSIYYWNNFQFVLSCFYLNLRIFGRYFATSGDSFYIRRHSSALTSPRIYCGCVPVPLKIYLKTAYNHMLNTIQLSLVGLTVKTLFCKGLVHVHVRDVFQ